MLFLYSNLMRWYKKLEPDSPWNCTAMTQATTWENLTGCWEKLCHCQGGNHRSRWCRGTVECLSLEWKPHWTRLWRTCSHQMCSAWEGRLFHLWRILILPTSALLWFPATPINIFPVLGASPKYFYTPDPYFCKNVKIFVAISAYEEIWNIKIHPYRDRLVAKWRQQNQRCKIP